MKNIIWITGMLFLLSPVALRGQGCAEPASDEGVKVWGYLQPEFDMKFTDKNQAAFLMRRMRVGVMGNIPYDFGYYLLVETSQFINPDRTGAFLLDGFVTWKRYRYLKVALGAFKYQFGRELSTPCFALYTINRSKFVDELTASNYGTNRDVGMMILGGNDTTFLTYAVSVTNGNGILNIDKDNLGNTYMINGRVTIQPIRKLYFGASVRYGENPPESEDVEKKDTKFRYGVDGQYSIGGFTLLAEYMHGKDEGSYLEGGGCGGEPVLKTGTNNADGYYIMGVYRFPFNLEPVYKFESYTTKRDEGSDTPVVKNTSYCQTFGLNYYPNDWTRLQVNYVYRAERPTEVNNDGLYVQIQVKF